MFVSLLIVLAVTDSDQDGIPDSGDNCADSGTTVVDQFGCSCTQKTCPAGQTCINDNGEAVCSSSGSDDGGSSEDSDDTEETMQFMIDCFADASPGNAEDAEYFSLGDPLIYETAIQALQEYGITNSGASSDDYIEAVASYVDNHMEWVKDGGAWDDKQSARRTINESGSRECGADYCGDCEDHAILRAALLRSLGVSWKCVYSADAIVKEDEE